MAINLKKIGHITAIILIITGLLIVWIGQNMIESDFVRNNGLVGVMFVVLGILFMLGGALLTIITFISWVFGTLVHRFGFKALFLAIGIIGLSFFVYKLFVPFGSFGDPISIGTIDGIVYKEPSFAESIDTIFSPNSSVLLISKTDSISNGYPWFMVAYNESSKGYMWGGNLCAQDIWVNGLSGRCTSHQQKTIMTSFDRNKIDASTKHIDVIDVIQKLLPGSWYNPSFSYTFNQQGEILDEDNVIGRWTVEIDEGSKQHVWLTLKGNDQSSWISKKQRIKGINSLWLYLNDESYSRIEESKWGLTIAERIQIEGEIFKSRDRARKEIEKKFSADMKHPQFYNHLNILEKKYAKELAIKYGIPTATLDSIEWNWR